MHASCCWTAWVGGPARPAGNMLMARLLVLVVGLCPPTIVHLISWKAQGGSTRFEQAQIASSPWAVRRSEGACRAPVSIMAAISAIMFLDMRGKPVLMRDYRCD